MALSMAAAVIVKNNHSKTLKLCSAILSHFKFKSRHGSAIQGVKGCYCSHPPLSSRFGILSSAAAIEPPGWFSFLSDMFNGKGNDKALENKLDSWTVEDEVYTMLRSMLCRVYTAPPMERLTRIYNTPPSKYETIDQGSGLGFRVIRMGI